MAILEIVVVTILSLMLLYIGAVCAQYFRIIEYEVIQNGIDRKNGVLWVVSMFSCLIAIVLYIIFPEIWWIDGFVLIVILQISIVIYWKQTWYITFLNFLVFVATLVGMMYFIFLRGFNNDKDSMLSSIDDSDKSIISFSSLITYPVAVQKWLNQSGIIGKTKIKSVHMSQNYKLKLKVEDKEYSDATAEQYSITNPPAFLWRLEMRMMSFLRVFGKDKYQDGKGSMVISLLGLLKIVNENGHVKLNEGTLQRYLGELIWYPSLALSPLIQWEHIDNRTVNATISYKDTTATGTFRFDENGNLIEFRTMRFKDTSNDSQRIPWFVEIDEFGTFDGIRIPIKCKATWTLDSGNWTWSHIHVNSAMYSFN